jgi:general secretion pathway protein D
VLIELGRVAQIDVDIDPSISGGVIINAKNRPFKEVIDRIATLGKLRYTYLNGVLHFERDAPYMKNYFVDYLIDGQLWGDVETNIKSILTISSSDASSLGVAGAASSGGTSSLSSNKSAGIISVFATEKEHEMVLEYLADVESSASSQVLIEAKVVEVSLNEIYRTGINWSSLGNKIETVGGLSVGGAAGGLTTSIIKIFNNNLSAKVDALEEFGTTRTISSPRIHAMNNQKASLNFGDKLVYFKIDNNQTVTTTSGSTPVNTASITSTKIEENIGVQLDITPSINVKTDEIVMNIKPTLSLQNRTVTDPASPVGGAKNEVPVIQTRSLSTIAKVKSGEVLVIGGLMKDSTDNRDIGVPFLNRIPVLGWFFKSVAKKTDIVETVIFIKATIIKGTNKVDKNDRDIQQKFDTNRRRYFNN